MSYRINRCGLKLTMDKTLVCFGRKNSRFYFTGAREVYMVTCAWLYVFLVKTKFSIKQSFKSLLIKCFELTSTKLLNDKSLNFIHEPNHVEI